MLGGRWAGSFSCCVPFFCPRGRAGSAALGARLPECLVRLGRRLGCRLSRRSRVGPRISFSSFLRSVPSPIRKRTQRTGENSAAMSCMIGVVRRSASRPRVGRPALSKNTQIKSPAHAPDRDRRPADTDDTRHTRRQRRDDGYIIRPYVQPFWTYTAYRYIIQPAIHHTAHLAAPLVRSPYCIFNTKGHSSATVTVDQSRSARRLCVYSPRLVAHTIPQPPVYPLCIFFASSYSARIDSFVWSPASTTSCASFCRSIFS
jgi:hypothetical protein